MTIQAQILQLMAQLRREQGTAILLITHNMGVVAQLCDYVYVMYAGEIVEEAETFALFRHPRHPYTQGLLQAIPSLEGGTLTPIPGAVPELVMCLRQGMILSMIWTVYWKNLTGCWGCRFCGRCARETEACRAIHPALEEAAPGHRVRCLYA